ncbi:hypothetical protein KP509_03G028700 [Ceratopteris richardii]|uniref:Uncharacterized protein n=1 Tax=Ceratopteris richardii TaxID=49495 RepID=A0A8T2V5R3_CERRI|nr:hypothetical protein KP509_03G028700 [Ceratopteris richardii]
MADDSPQNQPALVDRDPKAPQSHALDASREQFYFPSYQPSAPPEPFFNHADELSHKEALHNDPYQEPSGLPPGTRLVDIFSDAFGRFWRTSHTVLRLDLRRSINVDPITRIRESDSPRRPYRGRGRQGYSEDWGEEGPSSSWFQGIHGGGARMKLMQVWDFPNKESGLPSLPGNLNFGCGAAIETDGGGHLELEARIKAKHVALYILPSPLLQLHGKWPIPGTPLAVDVRYRFGNHQQLNCL